jgi:hypothetical protein
LSELTTGSNPKGGGGLKTSDFIGCPEFPCLDVRYEGYGIPEVEIDPRAEVSSLKELMAIGVYLTRAGKCGKTRYGIKAGTSEECSPLLEGEIALSSNRWNLFIHQPGLGCHHLSNCCGHAALHG